MKCITAHSGIEVGGWWPVLAGSARTKHGLFSDFWIALSHMSFPNRSYYVCPRKMMKNADLLGFNYHEIVRNDHQSGIGRCPVGRSRMVVWFSARNDQKKDLVQTGSCMALSEHWVPLYNINC